MAEELIRIAMLRDNLEDIPQYPLPPEYLAQWYKPGYEKHWLDIHLAADHYGSFGPGFFADQFGSDAQPLAQRQ